MNQLQKLCLKLFISVTCFTTSLATASCPSSPLDISTTTPLPILADQSQIGMDGNRNTISIWREFDGTNTYVKSSILPFGGVWSPPAIVSTIAGGFLDVTPQIAVNPVNGDAIAIWMQNSNTLLTSTLPFGGSWSVPVTLSTTATLSNGAPQIAIRASPANYAVVVWVTNATKVFSAYLNGGVWTTDIAVIPETHINMRFPKIGIDSSGNAMTTYYVIYDSVTKRVLYNILPFGGPEWNLADYLTDTPGGILSGSAMSLAVAPSGYTLFAYSTDHSGGSDQIVICLKYLGGVWNNILETSSDTPNLEPTVAIDINQNGVLLWSAQSTTGRDIKAAFLPYTEAGHLGFVATLTNNAIGESSIQPNVSVDVDGNAYATWLTVAGENKTIQFSRLPFAGPWPTLNCDVFLTGDNVKFPHITSYAFGYAAMNWTNASTTTIQASLFPAPPTEIDPASGSTSGGNTVVITGTGFNNVTSVEFGSGNFVSFTIISDTEIVVAPPPGSLGSENVILTTSEGVSSIAYTYLNPICWQR